MLIHKFINGYAYMFKIISEINPVIDVNIKKNNEIIEELRATNSQLIFLDGP